MVFSAKIKTVEFCDERNKEHFGEVGSLIQPTWQIVNLKINIKAAPRWSGFSCEGLVKDIIKIRRVQPAIRSKMYLRILAPAAGLEPAT
ncbi:MAG: hypothetical protein NZ875_07845 [Pseudothermotoga sp.]|nr:hypothetical protein [Pseudothermotoga sp.]MDW8140304.1 hypothetical protein [Pseudothermotoga sp.]